MPRVTGSRGIAGLALDCGAAGAGWFENVFSSTDFGAAVRVDIIWRTNARPRKKPALHQVALVRIVPACRIPMKASGEELAPPKLAANPLPLPDCSKIVAIRTTASMTRIMTRNL